MRRIIERIDPCEAHPRQPFAVDVTARDIMGDDIMGEPYTFRVEGEEQVAAIYAEAKA